MRKLLIIVLCIGLFVWGVVKVLDRKDHDLDNVGEVSVIRTIDGNSESHSVKGSKLNKCFRDKVTEFDIAPLSELASDAVTVEKPEVVDDENNIALKYKGDFIDEEEKDIYYSIYDSDFNLLYQSDTLGVAFEKGKAYYAVVDVKWGRIKNYVCLRYCIKITT
jgi:hypothetical protein